MQARTLVDHAARGFQVGTNASLIGSLFGGRNLPGNPSLAAHNEHASGDI